MNEHAIQRIAAAMNQARPDWPLQQLKTLLGDARMVDRPRRDVFVALAWVASEPSTSNPYRVLEAGPWWKAAGIEGSAARREVLNPAERCGICAKPESRCRISRVADDDHEFEPDFKHKRDGETVHQIVQSVKAEVAPTPTIAEPKKLDDLLPEQRNPHVAEVRAQLATTHPTAALPNERPNVDV